MNILFLEIHPFKRLHLKTSPQKRALFWGLLSSQYIEKSAEIKLRFLKGPFFGRVLSCLYMEKPGGKKPRLLKGPFFGGCFLAYIWKNHRKKNLGKKGPYFFGTFLPFFFIISHQKLYSRVSAASSSCSLRMQGPGVRPR